MRIYIATHTHTPLYQDEVYQPLFVGAAALSERRYDDWLYDDVGDSISDRNATFCELTGLYWMWKHATDDIVGLVHYRRYLKADDASSQPLTEAQLRSALDAADCLVAQRVYYPWSCAADYRMCHCATDLLALRLVVAKHFPAYRAAFDTVMGRDWFFPCNIAVWKKSLADEFYHFLFGVTDWLERSIDPILFRPPYQQRVYGFLSERLLNIFIEAKGLQAEEFPLLDPAHPEDDSTLAHEPYPAHGPIVIGEHDFVPVLDGTNMSRVFDPVFYARHYADAWRQAEGSPQGLFEHYLEEGIAQGRMAHPGFSIASYANGHPELHETLGGDYRSWCKHYALNVTDDAFATGFENLTLQPTCAPESLPESTLHRSCLKHHISPRHIARIARATRGKPVID